VTTWDGVEDRTTTQHGAACAARALRLRYGRQRRSGSVRRTGWFGTKRERWHELSPAPPLRCLSSSTPPYTCHSINAAPLSWHSAAQHCVRWASFPSLRCYWRGSLHSCACSRRRVTKQRRRLLTTLSLPLPPTTHALLRKKLARRCGLPASPQTPRCCGMRRVGRLAQVRDGATGLPHPVNNTAQRAQHHCARSAQKQTGFRRWRPAVTAAGWRAPRRAAFPAARQANIAAWTRRRARCCALLRPLCKRTCYRATCLTPRVRTPAYRAYFAALPRYAAPSLSPLRTCALRFAGALSRGALLLYVVVRAFFTWYCIFAGAVRAAIHDGSLKERAQVCDLGSFRRSVGRAARTTGASPASAAALVVERFRDLALAAVMRAARATLRRSMAAPAARIL